MNSWCRLKRTEANMVSTCLHMSPQLNATFKLFKERCRHDVLIEASWTFKNDSCPFDFSLWLKKWGYRNFGGFSGWNSVEKVPLKMAWWLQVRNPRLHGSGWAMLACGPPGGASDFFKPTVPWLGIAPPMVILVIVCHWVAHMIIIAGIFHFLFLNWWLIGGIPNNKHTPINSPGVDYSGRGETTWNYLMSWIYLIYVWFPEKKRK